MIANTACSCVKIHPSRGAILVLEKIEHLVAPEIYGLEEEMARILGSDHPFLQELNRRTMASPGKRLRPKLLILCSKMLGYQGPLPLLFAAVFELVHTATLIHDDIIDDADMRRGRMTLNRELGTAITVLYGDFVYTKSYSAAVEIGNLDALKTITWVSQSMIEGEILQNKYNFDLEIDEGVYFDILTRKTAHLFAGITKTAGLLAGLNEADLQALFEFGMCFGKSFQLIDDYLDYLGSAAQMGKPVLSDLREGKVTLPVIRLLARRGSAIGETIRHWWRHVDRPIPPSLLEALQGDSGLRETKQMADRYAHQAVGFLDRFPVNEFSETLKKIPLHLLERSH